MLANSITDLSALYKADTKDKTAGKADPYATAAQSAAVLRSGAEFRKNRMAAADMLTTDEAAELAGVSRVTINAWIKQNRCIGIANLRRGFKLPKWQFEPQVFELIQPLLKRWALRIAGACLHSLKTLKRRLTVAHLWWRWHRANLQSVSCN